MFSMKPLVLGALVGGGAMYFADRNHVVHTADGMVVVPRAHQAALRSAYADVRGWSPERWGENTDLTESVIKDGREQLMAATAIEKVQQEAQHALEALIPLGQSAAPQRPEIVFEQPVPPVDISSPIAASDDSLLGRLTRQNQPSQRHGEPIHERPLTRERPAAGDALAPVRPAATPPAPIRDDRAERPPVEDDAEMTLHSAALERVKTDLSEVASSGTSLLDDLSAEMSAAFPETAKDSIAEPEFEPEPLAHAGGEASVEEKSKAPAENWNRPLARDTLPRDRIRLPQSDSFDYLPLEIDAERLADSIPRVVRDELRSLQPTHPEQDSTIKPL